MSDVERFHLDLHSVGDGRGVMGRMVPSTTGGYVRHCDYDALAAENARLRSIINEAKNTFTVMAATDNATGSTLLKIAAQDFLHWLAMRERCAIKSADQWLEEEHRSFIERAGAAVQPSDSHETESLCSKCGKVHKDAPAGCDADCW